MLLPTWLYAGIPGLEVCCVYIIVDVPIDVWHGGVLGGKPPLLVHNELVPWLM